MKHGHSIKGIAVALAMVAVGVAIIFRVPAVKKLVVGA